MQANNVIYELAKQIKDINNIKNDMNMATQLVFTMFKEKYLDKIKNEFEKKLEHIDKNPTKEITLLRAIKPFFNEENNNIDNTINIFKNFSAINLIKNETNFNSNLNIEEKIEHKNLSKNEDLVFINSLGEKDPSVKEDGVYDIDENCMFGIECKNNMGFNPIIILLFILLFNN